ncbi:unnamed protein product [Adineta steineri]|uniref:Uncharacterized protein n=1 Tax=Adineta steineri TaxID=433720 RepID=A0A813MFU7_9BILA|nr:unnamed protein product [Adineta steineri]
MPIGYDLADFDPGVVVVEVDELIVAAVVVVEADELIVAVVVVVSFGLFGVKSGCRLIVVWICPFKYSTTRISLQ